MGSHPFFCTPPQLMKTSLSPTPNRSRETERAPRATVPVTDYSYQSAAPATAANAVQPQKHRVELTNFRALSRNFFGAEAHREYIREAIVFAWIMVVAAWPLGITLNMLGTMMISPPPWVVNDVVRVIG